MAKDNKGDSKIPWTEYVFNPWIGCQKVSPGCLNCYASDRWAPRAGRTGCYGPDGQRQRTAEAYWRKPLAWNALAERDGTRPFVFCGSFCDIFEWNIIYGPGVTFGVESSDVLSDLWNLIEQTPNLQWLLLTKRPQNIDGSVPEHWRLNGMSNVWPGVTICNRAEMMGTAKQFLGSEFVQNSPKCFASFEPLLEEPYPVTEVYCRFDWVIAGCESGGKRRHVARAAFQTLRDCAAREGIPFFLKQMEINGKVVGMPKLDGKVWNQMPEVNR